MVAPIDTRLYELMDRGAPQGELNERMAANFVEIRTGVSKLEELCERVSSDHEKRIRWIERAVSLFVGGGAVVSVVLQLIFHYVK